jgi:pescadillo protein
VHLFSKLPTNPIPGKTLVPTEVIAECARLNNEWKVWAIRTHALRKVFLGIKGVYYEVEVPGHGGEPVTVRWLEGYEFQQHVPHDVDFRILLTFLELYRTVCSFVLYKLYTDENLVYPPPLDVELDQRGEAVGAFRLVENKTTGAAAATVSKKAVKRAIKGITAGGDEDDEDVEMAEAEEDEDEEFVERPAKNAEVEDVATGVLPTYTSLLAKSDASANKDKLLFSPYTFYLSRETSSRTWEFVIRAMGGKVVTSLAAPSPGAAPNADAITHVLIDRPMTDERRRELEGGRKWVWVQPQWVADCVNRAKVLSTEEYGPGKLLPPHLSPWDGEGEPERPWLEAGEEGAAEEGVDAEEEESDEDEDEDEEKEEEEEPAFPPALLAAAKNPEPALMNAAELEAEQNGMSSADFKAKLKEATKLYGGKKAANGRADEDLRKIMMSNKKAKLYEKMKYGNAERQAEVSTARGRCGRPSARDELSGQR